MVVSYQVGLVICIILMVVGVTVGTMSLINSVKEVTLLREMGEKNIYHHEEHVIGSPGSSMLGAVIAGLVSATLVALYGADGNYLYLGPIAAMVAAVSVIFCFIQDIRDESTLEKLLEAEQAKGAGKKG